MFNKLLCVTGACPTLCSGNGNYVRGQCQCHYGWKGQECDVREGECEVPNCNGNGRCVDGQCVCYDGFKGPDCGEGKNVTDHPPQVKLNVQCNYRRNICPDI